MIFKQLYKLNIWVNGKVGQRIWNGWMGNTTFEKCGINLKNVHVVWWKPTVKFISYNRSLRSRSALRGPYVVVLLVLTSKHVVLLEGQSVIAVFARQILQCTDQNLTFRGKFCVQVKIYKFFALSRISTRVGIYLRLDRYLRTYVGSTARCLTIINLKSQKFTKLSLESLTSLTHMSQSDGFTSTVSTTWRQLQPNHEMKIKWWRRKNKIMGRWRKIYRILLC